MYWPTLSGSALESNAANYATFCFISGLLSVADLASMPQIAPN